MAKAASKAAPEAVGVTIPPINLQTIEFYVEGLSALIVHAWSDKAIRMIEDKQQKKAKTAREAKNPQEEYEASFYRNAKGEYAFPASGLKACAVDACTFIDGMTKVSARGAFHIIGDMVKIDGKPRMRTDMVRIGMGTADVRYRGEFPEWKAKLQVQFNANVISAEQILNLFDNAGYSVGIGEWRPQKDGSFGRFRVQR